MDSRSLWASCHLGIQSCKSWSTAAVPVKAPLVFWKGREREVADALAKLAKEKESRPASGGGGIMNALQMAINKNRKKIAMSDSDDDSDWSDGD